MPKPRSGKKNKQPIKPTFRIFCEGEKPEPQYFRSLIDDLFPGKRNLVVIEDCKPNTPVEIVEAAIQARCKGHADDEIWAVYDREAVNKYPHELHKQAADLANSNGIEISITNICFEFWLLLHFEYTAAQYSSYSDLVKNSKLKQHFKNLGLVYDKATPEVYDKTRNNLEDAIKRAKQVRNTSIKAAEKGKESAHYLNPYINIDTMINSMSSFVKKYG